MNTSENGLRQIACREAMVAVAYADDTTGGSKCSIGFGSQTGNPKPGDTITVADALARLRNDIAVRDMVIAHSLSVSITQWQWDALASLYYQAGSAALRDVATLFNAGKPADAICRFATWAHGGDGVLTLGHMKRRAREMLIAVAGDYGDISTFLLFDGDPRKVKPVSTPFPT